MKNEAFALFWYLFGIFYLLVVFLLFFETCLFCDLNFLLQTKIVKIIVSSFWSRTVSRSRNSHLEVLLENVVLKICSKFTGEHPCQSVTSMNLLCNFIELTLRYKCSPVNFLHIFRTPFNKNASGWRLL